nr:hypothetical transcript [Hymenolepis microstoma]
MQVYGVEEYRIAALAAWECISAPAEASIGRSSSAYKELAHESTRAHRGHNDDQEPIQAEIWTMNLSDDSGKVRRKALRILRAYKKSRSTACCLDVPP